MWLCKRSEYTSKKVETGQKKKKKFTKVEFFKQACNYFPFSFIIEIGEQEHFALFPMSMNWPIVYYSNNRGVKDSTQKFS